MNWKNHHNSSYAKNVVMHHTHFFWWIVQLKVILRVVIVCMFDRIFHMKFRTGWFESIWFDLFSLNLIQRKSTDFSTTQLKTMRRRCNNELSKTTWNCFQLTVFMKDAIRIQIFYIVNSGAISIIQFGQKGNESGIQSIKKTVNQNNRHDVAQNK